MCGRFTSKASGREIEKEFVLEIGSAETNDVLNTVRYNIAPTQMIAAARLASERREISPFKWSLIPSWAKDDSIGSKLIKYDKPARKISSKQWRVHSCNSKVLSDRQFNL